MTFTVLGAWIIQRTNPQPLSPPASKPLNLDRWRGFAEDDGLTTEQVLQELRGRPVPWVEPAQSVEQ